MLSKDMFQNRAKLDNPWWETGNVANEYAYAIARLSLDELYSRILPGGPRRALLLMGPRRVGKTWLLQHAIQRLLKENVYSPRQIIYFSLDVPVYNGIGLEELINTAAEITGISTKTDKLIVFFDEIQYLKDWESHLKTLVDSYSNIRFVASGSAASALQRGSMESGAGRFSDMLLGPLSFREFIHLTGNESIFTERSLDTSCGTLEIPSTESIETANRLFLDYINAGGYPELVMHADVRENAVQFIQRDIVDKVLLRDLPSLYHIDDVRDLQSFFSYLAFHTGSVQSYENLSQGSGLSKHTVGNFLHYLEDAFLIVRHNRIDINALSLQRATQFKLYLTNPSLRASMFQPVRNADDPWLGNVVETAISAQLGFGAERALWRYANWKTSGRSQGEVDFVKLHPGSFRPMSCLEVKWSDGPFDHVSELDKAISFTEQNNLSQLLVTTRTQQGIRHANNTEILYIPTSLYAYSLDKSKCAK